MIQQARKAMETQAPKWKTTWHPARLETRINDGCVKCGLCPRGCVLTHGQEGFCGVRGNRDGRLVTFTYGKGVMPSEECIETEAVYHFDPGARILSLGNIGCNLKCIYCQNWETSQARHVRDEDVWHLSVEDVIAKAQKHKINILSWTYNDPIVWHEFLLETAAEARKAGLVNLFKSAFFITPEAIDELLPMMDIFTVSVKSADPSYYRKITSGTLPPVLEGAKRVHRAGKHVEVSNLMVTGLSDTEEDARKMAGWLIENLGPDVPLHFVRFHPAHQYTETVRTPVEHLRRAKEIAESMGIRHVYVGNVFDPELATSRCKACGEVLVRRFGLRAEMVNLAENATCRACGAPANFRLNAKNRTPADFVAEPPADGYRRQSGLWSQEINGINVRLVNTLDEPRRVFCRNEGPGRLSTEWRAVSLGARESLQVVLGRSEPGDEGYSLLSPEGVTASTRGLLDRAHYPIA